MAKNTLAVCQCFFHQDFCLYGIVTILDIDECTSGVPCQQICTNTRGSFQCNCSSGYTVDGNMCNGQWTCYNCIVYVKYLL